LGQEFYRRQFGRSVTVGYNVDSFGHGAYLPRFLRQGGLDSYVFMRPAQEEKQLPANLFRWRSPDGFEVVTFRIPGSYQTSAADIGGHVEKSLEFVPEGIEHTMCFFGVGDHGGGPTKAQIEWIRGHADDIDGAKLIFSHPRAFFDAVACDIEKMPVVQGELQHYAIGCYTVRRPIKTAMRRAEAMLIQAEGATEVFAKRVQAEQLEEIARNWECVLFNQFHDILGGTCLDGCALETVGQLAAAESDARKAITTVTRRAFRNEAEPSLHKIVVFNPSGEPFEGCVVHEPWVQWDQGEYALRDSDGRGIPTQWLPAQALMPGMRTMLFQTSVPARGWLICELIKSQSKQPAEGPRADADRLEGSSLRIDGRGLSNHHVRVSCDGEAMKVNNWSLRLDVLEDLTDTWGHSACPRFDGRRLGGFSWGDGIDVVEKGPIRAAGRRFAAFDRSEAWCRVILVDGEPMLRLQLAVVWAQARQLLRLRLDAPEEIAERTDLVSGGPLVRPTDGLEYPLGGGMMATAGKEKLALVSPEIFSASVDPGGISLTLLRSPHAAHHEPVSPQQRPDATVTDQGAHLFDLLIWPNCHGEVEDLAALARQMMMPPICWDLTG